MYLHLARASSLRRQPLVSDKLLVLAGATAAEMGLGQIAALCRQKILVHNTQHLVRDWPNFDAALADDRFLSYLKQLRRRYSPEKAEHMLQTLGIELARERELYINDHEYAAALLGTTPEMLAQGDSADTHSHDVLKPPAKAVTSPGSQPAVSWKNLVIEWGPPGAGLLVLAALCVISWIFKI